MLVLKKRRRCPFLVKARKSKRVLRGAKPEPCADLKKIKANPGKWYPLHRDKPGYVVMYNDGEYDHGWHVRDDEGVLHILTEQDVRLLRGDKSWVSHLSEDISE